MAQTVFHAYIGYNLKKILPKERFYTPSIIFGALLPDIDKLFVIIGSLYFPLSISKKLFHSTFSHSFFTLLIIYLISAFIAEWKKKPILKNVSKGLALGMLSHIIIDTLLSFNHIHLLWPLPFNSFNLWIFNDIPESLINTILASDFFLFYCYFWFLIKKHLELPSSQSWVVNYLQKLKVAEGVLFIIFILLINYEYSFNLFLIAYKAITRLHATKLKK